MRAREPFREPSGPDFWQDLSRSAAGHRARGEKATLSSLTRTPGQRRAPRPPVLSGQPSAVPGSMIPSIRWRTIYCAEPTSGSSSMTTDSRRAELAEMDQAKTLGGDQLPSSAALNLGCTPELWEAMPKKGSDLCWGDEIGR